MVGIVDYGVGNLFSLRSSFARLGAEVLVSGEAEALAGCDRIVLPGVGAFRDAAGRLRESGLAACLREEAAKGKPLLGICLGMQLFFEKSYEYGCHEGLGLIPGEVRPISEVCPEGLKIPHIGWNGLHFPDGRPRCPLFSDLQPGDSVYFVHSYQATGCADYVTATAEYGAPLTAAAACGRVYATQFHPEKSGDVGLSVLRAFCEL